MNRLISLESDQRPRSTWDSHPLWPMNAETMLRQSVHYCVSPEKNQKFVEMCQPARDVLASLMDQFRLASKTPGSRTADDATIESLSQTIFKSTPSQSAEAAAAALAEGFSLATVAEAISIAGNQLVLRDSGRRANQVSKGKPEGSVHGDSIGVHACDTINAWRNMAQIASPRNAAACTIMAAHQVARDRTARGEDFGGWQLYPLAEHYEKLRGTTADELLKEADAAIRENDQARACAAVARFAETSQSARPVFDLMLQYAISEDGALHAEKFYRTVTEEFAAILSITHNFDHLFGPNVSQAIAKSTILRRPFQIVSGPAGASLAWLL